MTPPEAYCSQGTLLYPGRERIRSKQLTFPSAPKNSGEAHTRMPSGLCGSQKDGETVSLLPTHLASTGSILGC